MKLNFKIYSFRIIIQNKLILYMGIDMIKKRPTLSIKKLYDEKELELTIKYGAKDVAKYWPQFDSVDSAFFSIFFSVFFSIFFQFFYKNKLIPALPQSINDFEDLPNNYKVTKDIIKLHKII
jgi:hypothetical protein